MSRIVKSAHVILDDRKFALSPLISNLAELVATEEMDREIQDSDDETLMAEPNIDVEQMLDEVNTQIREMMGEAEKEKGVLLEDAYEQSKAIMESAKRDGFQQGYDEGYAKGYQEAQGYIEEALNLRNESLQKYKDILEGSEVTIVETIVNITEKILHQKIEDDHQLIEGLVRGAITKCVNTEKLTIRVANQDVEYVENVKNSFLPLIENIDEIIVKGDAYLAAGSCIIDTDVGSVDSSVWSQFEHLRDEFELLLKSE